MGAQRFTLGLGTLAPTQSVCNETQDAHGLVYV